MNVDLSYFPYEKIRDQQKLVLDRVAKSDKNKVIIQCGTGTGKSGIAWTIAKSNGKTLIVTPTKQLQDQYVGDFQHLGLVEMKGEANYICALNSKLDYSNAVCRLDRTYMCKKTFECPYKKAIEDLKNSQVAVVNYSWFCQHASGKTRLSEEYFKDVQTIIFDEAHNLESQLASYYSAENCPVEFVDYYYRDKVLNDTQAKALKDFKDSNNQAEYIENFSAFYAHIISPIIAEMDADQDPSHADHWEFLKNMRPKYEYMLDHSDSPYAVTVTEHNHNKVITFEPIYVDGIFNELVGNRKCVFMSATILDLDTYTKSIGIKKSSVDYIEYDSPFDPEKSPIIYGTNIDCSWKGFDDEQKALMLDAIDQICKIHANEKGIIHTGNQRITQLIKSLNNPRFLIREGNVTNDVILQQHINSSRPTILVSSSMLEGVDLKDDLSRFQIICKMPYPSLLNERIKTKTSIDSNWYSLQTWYRFMQASGRSTRNENDTSKTYVLDKAFLWELHKFQAHLPEQFKGRLMQLC